MKKRLTAILLLSVQILAGCAETSETDVQPLMGLNWFIGYEDVKSELTGQKLIGERINTEGKIPQKIQDYADVTLFGHILGATAKYP